MSCSHLSVGDTYQDTWPKTEGNWSTKLFRETRDSLSLPGINASAVLSSSFHASPNIFSLWQIDGALGRKYYEL